MLIEPGDSGICPNCGLGVRFEHASTGYSINKYWHVYSDPQGEKSADLQLRCSQCPECTGLIVSVIDQLSEELYPVWPLTPHRNPLPANLPESIGQDFQEACRVLPFSEKASAALSRRCLQSLLIENEDVDEGDSLAAQIDAVLNELPGYVAKEVDAIRNFGNFSAHPIETEDTDRIIDVEPEEAEWLLDILETLFDYYYVKPLLTEERLAGLNKKLEEAGKPPAKQPSENDS